MKHGIIGCTIGLATGVVLTGLAGMGQTSSTQPAHAAIQPPAGNGRCVVHLTLGDVGLDRSSQTTTFNGRVFKMNDLAMRAEGTFESFGDGWLELSCEPNGAVWIPEHAIRAIEWIPASSSP